MEEGEKHATEEWLTGPKKGNKKESQKCKEWMNKKIPSTAVVSCRLCILINILRILSTHLSIKKSVKSCFDPPIAQYCWI